MNVAIDGTLLALSPTNLLALLAVALFAHQYGVRAIIGLTLAFAIGVAVGSLLIAGAVRSYPAVETQLGIATVAGIFAAAAYRPPLFIVVMVVFAEGEGLALNTPPQAITLSGAAMSQIASGVAGMAIFLLVALCAVAADQSWRRIALRILSSWIAASAILVLALRLAR
jgi:urease accessory protein